MLGNNGGTAVVDMPVPLSPDSVRSQPYERPASPRKAVTPSRGTGDSESTQPSHDPKDGHGNASKTQSRHVPQPTHASHHHRRHSSVADVPHPTTVVGKLATLHSKWHWVNWACASLLPLQAAHARLSAAY
jgi:hypothetical protein